MRSSRSLAFYLRPYWKWAVLAPFFMALEVTMDLLQPRLVQHIIDQGIGRSDLNLVLHDGALMILFALIGLLTGGGCTVYATLAAQGFGADLRGAMFRRVQEFSFANLDAIETGPLITRLTNDSNQVQELVMTLLRTMVRAPLLLIGGLVMAILTSPKLALLFLVLIPIVLVVLISVTQRTYPMFGRVQKRLDTLNTVLQENLSGVRVVKAFARADFENQRFGKANDALMSQNITAVRLSAVTMPIMMVTLNFGVVAALWMGGVSVSRNALQVGQVVAFINYLMTTLMSLMMVSMLVIQVARAEASAGRVKEVLDTTPTIANAPDATALPAPQGRIEYQNVSFSYDGTDHDPVLCDISFEAAPGETVAFLGATGAGKSSLVSLLPRFYDVTKGRITLDGVDIRALDEKALRQTVGIALQESILWSGTIRDNIRYGRPDASDEEVRAAAKLAQADEFISRLPDGYDAVVGQRGVNLSGGQKQRIAIARALLPRPRVLILDDSTSALDVRTEANLNAALREQPFPQTRLIVAQRISTVLGADKIIVLGDGVIAAQGTHEQLLQTSPIYQEIYQSQMRNGVIDHSGE